MLKVLPEELNDENALPHLSLDEIARLGAKKLLREALELEVEEYVYPTPLGFQVPMTLKLSVKNVSNSGLYFLA